MPRSQESAHGKILRYFRTAELAEASLMLGLVREAVGERTQRSAKAKAIAVKVAKVVTAPTKPAAHAPAPAAKKTHRRNPKRTTKTKAAPATSVLE